MTRYIPVVVIVDEDTLNSPELAAVVAAVERNRALSPEMDELAKKNGWSSGALAGGMLLAAAIFGDGQDDEEDDLAPDKIEVTTLDGRVDLIDGPGSATTLDGA